MGHTEAPLYTGQAKEVDINKLKKWSHHIVKLQALWRGNRARRDVEFLKKSKRADSRYFTIEESKETMSKKPYNPNARREKRPLFRYKTGATYEGEWVGGFRDG